MILTEKALSKIASILQTENNKNLKLRAYIIGGGCAGFEYGFNFDEVINEDDQQFEFVHQDQKIILLVDYMSLQYLQGATVDYKEDLQGARFAVENPNAETTCSCGSSFSVAEPEDF